jgi:probable rRNA maturation factor
MIVNLQRKVKIDPKSLKAFIVSIETAFDEVNRRPFSVALVGNGRMKELNNFFRNKDTTTDVLSFPHEPDEFDPNPENLGDIVISVEQAKKQADENGLTLENEIKQLILHGLLHLCGYDHEIDNGEMDRRELELRERLSI